jgi:hypothetical protein
MKKFGKKRFDHRVYFIAGGNILFRTELALAKVAGVIIN